jgi:beta-glucosidase
VFHLSDLVIKALPSQKIAARPASLLEMNEDALRAKCATLSLEQKVSLLTGTGFWSLRAEPSIGLRSIVFSDGPNGVRGINWGDERDVSLLLPSLTCLAATWDPALVSEAGQLLAKEARRKGVDVLLAPTVSLHRSPLGGRNFESFSEDPFLTTQLAMAYINGLQHAGTGACIKHFVLNDSETQRRTYDVRIDERTLREAYLMPFEAAVRIGVAGILTSYNRVGGTTMTTNSRLNQDLLRQEWGYDGLLVSDWFASLDPIRSTLGGLDLAMPERQANHTQALLSAVRAGNVAPEIIDEHILRILRFAARVGGFAPDPGKGPDHPDPAATSAVRRLAARSIVLLRNDAVSGAPLLPLKQGLRRIAVIGPAADTPAYNGGGSSSVMPDETVSPLRGLREALSEQVVFDVVPAVVSRHLLPALESARCTDPVTGEPGLRVEMHGASGVLSSERRTVSRFVWINGMRGLPEGTTEIVITTRLRFDHSGTHRLSVIGNDGQSSLEFGQDETRSIDFGTVFPSDQMNEDDLEEMFRNIVSPKQVIFSVPGSADQVLDIRLSRPVNMAGLEVPISLGLGYDASTTNVEDGIAEAVRVAKDADAVLIFVGDTEEQQSESFDRLSLQLPGAQDALVAAVLEANPRTVVVMNAGAPVLMPWADNAPAIVWTGYCGQEYGHAITDVLLGVEEPTGRLPMSFPATPFDSPVLSTKPTIDGHLDYTEGLKFGYRGYDVLATSPLFAFGQGLGYTTWQYDSVRLEVHPEATPEDVLSTAATLTVVLTNTGTRTGREVIQVYADALPDDIEAAPRVLVGFTVASAAPAKQVEVQVQLSARALGRYLRDGWELPQTPRRLHIAHSSCDVRLECVYQPILSSWKRSRVWTIR